MFQAFIEIHHFPQVFLVEPDLAGQVDSLVRNHAADYGAGLSVPVPGTFVMEFRLQRHGDAPFVVRGLMDLMDRIGVHEAELYGMTMILDDTATGEEALRHFRSCILDARESRGMWIGSALMPALVSFLETEPSGRLFRVRGLGESGATDFVSFHRKVMETPEAQQVERVVRFELAHAFPGIRQAAFLSERDPSLPDLVHKVLTGMPEYGRDVFWIPGQDFQDPPELALVRGLYPMDIAVLDPFVPEADRWFWDQGKRFLFFGGRQVPAASYGNPCQPEWAQGMFRRLFHLFFMAMKNRSSREGKTFLVHVDRYSLLCTEAREMLSLLMKDPASREGEGVLWVFSGTCDTDVPPEMHRESVHSMNGVDKAGMVRMGLDPGSFGEGFPDLSGEAVTSRRILQWMELCRDHALSLGESPVHGMGMESGPWASCYRLLVGIMEPVLVEVLCACTLAWGFLDGEHLSRFLASVSIERIRIPLLLRQLWLLGLVRDEEICLISDPVMQEVLEAVCPETVLRLRTALSAWVVEGIEAGTLPLKIDMVLLLKELGASPAFFRFLEQHARKCIDTGNRTTLELLQDLGTHAHKGLSEPVQVKTADRILHMISVRGAIAFRDKDPALQYLPAPEDDDVGETSLLRARAVCRSEGYAAALHWVKKAMMQFQDASDSRGLADAQRFFGYLQFVAGRLSDAREYAILSRNNVVPGRDEEEILLSMALECQVNLVAGYHSRVAGPCAMARELVGRAMACGRFALALHACFLEGRSYFELGQYDEARESFLRAARIAESFGTPGHGALVQRWLFRTDGYRGRLVDPADISGDDTGEARIFIAEAMVREGRYPEALPILAGLDFHSRPSRFLPEEIPEDSGFACLEDRLFIGRDELFSAQLARVLGWYAAAHAGDPGPAIAGFLQLTRNPGRMLADPHCHWYLYLYADCVGLPGAGAGEDRATILGKAVKLQQEMAARIENPAQKRSFLQSAWWNRKLVADARLFNLA